MSARAPAAGGLAEVGSDDGPQPVGFLRLNFPPGFELAEPGEGLGQGEGVLLRTGARLDTFDKVSEGESRVGQRRHLRDHLHRGAP
ncbi:MAG: hypothetical protein KDB53_16590, partial [Planctomycetes bacterium]|nr:hypothetical protein [Planctomycetota bacterium]